MSGRKKLSQTSSSKRQYLQGGKVGAAECIDFKVFSPGQVSDELGCPVNECLVFGTESLVDDGSKTFPFCASTEWVDIGLDEADVALDDWAYIFYPVFRADLVRFDISCLESEW